MKKILLLAGIITLAFTSQAQDKYFTKNGKIVFDATSTKSPENISGINKNVTCVLDSKSGEIQFAVLMKGFEFDRALMMEHFNENYIESNKYPKTVFKGQIVNNETINYMKDAVYPAKVKGKLTMHNETKELEAEGRLTVKGGKITVTAGFTALLADYTIAIPQLVADKVSRSAKITVDCSLELLKK